MKKMREMISFELDKEIEKGNLRNLRLHPLHGLTQRRVSVVDLSLAMQIFETLIPHGVVHFFLCPTLVTKQKIVSLLFLLLNKFLNSWTWLNTKVFFLSR